MFWNQLVFINDALLFCIAYNDTLLICICHHFLTLGPVDGSWGSWIKWSQCSQSCGGGTETRKRLCEGGYQRDGAGKSCEKFDGISSFTSLPVRLVKVRREHLCWGLKSGDVLLLGGYWSKRTTERVSADGSSSKLDFKLPYSIE